MEIILAIAACQGLLGAIILAGLRYRTMAKASANLVAFDEEVVKRNKLFQDIKEIYKKLIGWSALRDLALQIHEQKELMKLERGRITITQAELETVENRLRELEEVEREIAASGIEAKEELRILGKKEKDLKSKNDLLKTQIADSLSKFDEVMSQIESNSQLVAQIENVKAELIRTETKTNELMFQIEQGNEQYFTLKQVYDALDIEYAQLYEKFADQNPGVAS